MAGSRDVKVNILGDSRDFSRAIASARGDANSLDSTFSRVNTGFSRMAGGLALGAAGVAAAVGVAGTAMALSFVQAAEESQQVTRQTEAVLESMGATAWISAQQVSALSTALSNQTGIDDELIQSGQNVLLTFGQVQNRVGEGRDIFDRATEAALNMSVALGTDMTSASMMIGKALNDPIRGLTQLRRSGIQFTEQQEEQIRAMVAAGDVVGAQVIMLQELDRQFGGSAEAQATATQRIATMWDNLKEKLGEKMLPAFEGFADWLSNNLPGIIDKAGEVWGGFVEKIQPVIDWVKEHWPEIKTTVLLALDSIQKRGDEFFGYVKGAWETFGEDIKASAGGMFGGVMLMAGGTFMILRGIFGIGMALIQGDWDKFCDSLGVTWDGMWKGMVGVTMFQSALFGGLVRMIWDGLIGAVTGAWNAFADRWDSISLTLPEVNIPGVGSFGGWTFDPPPAPRFHGGGTYRAPTPGGEGLAMLRDGERVLTPGQAANGDGTPVHVQVILDGAVVADSLARYTKNGGTLRVQVA